MQHTHPFQNPSSSPPSSPRSTPPGTSSPSSSSSASSSSSSTSSISAGGGTGGFHQTRTREISASHPSPSSPPSLPAQQPAVVISPLARALLERQFASLINQAAPAALIPGLTLPAPSVPPAFIAVSPAVLPPASTLYAASIPPPSSPSSAALPAAPSSPYLQQHLHPASPQRPSKLMSASSSSSSSSSAAAPSFSQALPASVRAILSDADLTLLASKLAMSPERLVTCLKNEGSLAYFKVSDLKTIIAFLKGRLGKSIRISGNKGDLTARIGEVLFAEGNAATDNDNSGPTQTTLSGYPGYSTSSSSAGTYEAGPPAKRARTSPPSATTPLGSNYPRAVLPAAVSSPYTGYHAPMQSAAAANARLAFNDPAFQQFQSPFYRVLKQLSVVSFGTKGRTNTASDRSLLVRHVFQVDPATVQEIKSGNERKLGVHIRFFSTLKQSDIPLGYESNLKVNGHPVDLAKNYKKIRSKHIQNPFITPYPADITSLVGPASNIMEFTNQKNYAGVAVIQLIQELTAEEILPSIPRSSPEYKKPTSTGAEIEETKVLVSLRCPLGYCRIEYPSKGIRCNHLQCFDVRFYLQFSHQQRLWHCPVCNGPIPFSELIIDEYFNSILKSMDSETMKAEIHPDGTFTKPDKSEKKQRLAGSKRKEVGVQEIDLDAEAAKQREARQANQANLEAEGSADGDSVVIPEGLILRPIRIERTSDDEEEIDPSGGLGDGGENGDLDGTFDDEEEFESERLPSDEHQEPPPAAAPSLRSSQSFSGPGSSQADTIIID